MQLKNILKPAPFKKEIEDKKKIPSLYRYWRLRTFYSMYLGYALFYFTRKSFTFAIPALKELGYSMGELGLLGSIFAIVYGISKFASGILGDRSNPRYFMAIGLMLTGVFNICFGLSSSIWMFALFWGANSWFQGWGWPASAKLLTHWYSQSERGRWWSVWNTSHNLGAAIIPILAAYMINHFGWSYAMYAPGVLSIICGFFLINRLRDTPQSLGLPSIEEYRNDYPDPKHKEKEKLRLSTKEILFTYVLKNWPIWLLAFSGFFVYMIRTAVNDWTQLYLVESHAYSLKTAAFCVCWFEIGGFFGSLVSGWLSDQVFKGKRNPINILFSLGSVIALVCLFAFGGAIVDVAGLSLPLFDIMFIFLSGFFIFGPQMLIGVAAAEISHKNAAGTATGFVGWISYLGAAFAGGPLGAIIQSNGWSAFLISCVFSGIIAALILIPLWSMKTNPKYTT